MKFYPEKIKYKKQQNAFLKENLKGANYILDKRLFLATYPEEIKYFRLSIFFDEYRLLNLLSQSFSLKNSLENDQNNQSHKRINYNDFRDIRDIGIFESDDKLDQFDDMTVLKKIVENRWFDNIKTEKEIHYLVSDFLESLPENTAKPLYYFWVLSQRFKQKPSENQEDSIEYDDSDIEKDVAIFEDIVFLNEWNLKSVRLNNLLNDVFVENISSHKQPVRRLVVSQLENINTQIFKWLVSYWLPRHDLIRTTFKKYPRLLKDPMNLLVDVSNNMASNYNPSELDKIDSENIKKILQTPLRHFHADEFPIVKYLRLNLKLETLMKFYLKDFHISDGSEGEIFDEKMTFLKKFLMMDYLNGASLKASFSRMEINRFEGISRMTEAFEKHLTFVFSSRRNKLEETFRKNGRVYEQPEAGGKSMKDQKNNFKEFVVQLKKFEEFLKIHHSAIHFEFFKNVQKCLNHALNNQQTNEIEDMTQYIFDEFINEEYFLSEKCPVETEDLKKLPGYEVGFDSRHMTNMNKHLFIKGVYELLYTKLNKLYDSMSRHSKHTKTITNRVDNTMYQRGVADNTCFNTINHSYREGINENSIEKHIKENCDNKDYSSNFVLNNNLSGRLSIRPGLQNGDYLENLESKFNDLRVDESDSYNGVEGYNKDEVEKRNVNDIGDDGSGDNDGSGGAYKSYGGSGDKNNYGGDANGNDGKSSWNEENRNEMIDKESAFDKKIIGETAKKENEVDGIERNEELSNQTSNNSKNNVTIIEDGKNINNKSSINSINNNTVDINTPNNMNNNINNNKNKNKISNLKDINSNKSTNTNNNSNITNDEEDGDDWLDMKKDFGLKRKRNASNSSRVSQSVSDKKQSVIVNRELEIKFKELLMNKKTFKKYCSFAKSKSEDLFFNCLFLKEVNIYKEMYSNRVNSSVLKNKINAIANKFFDAKDQSSPKVSIDAETIWKTMNKKRELNNHFFKEAEREVIVELMKYFEEFEAVKDDFIYDDNDSKYSIATLIPKSFKGKTRPKNNNETTGNQGLKIDYENLIKQERNKNKLLSGNHNKKLPSLKKNSKNNEMVNAVKRQTDETDSNRIAWSYSDYLEAYHRIKASMDHKKIVV